MRIIAAVGIATVLAMGNAFAADCPKVTSITQSADEQDGMEGIAYSVKNNDGQWAGFTPNASESDLSAFELKNKKDTKTSVICRYESGDEGISLALKK
ncbi:MULTISPECIES: hypothetical protein [Pseudomonas]|jgi:hypothetical protein|uniref:Acid stress chaperone HdeA n=1 Tax=Pseudomonas putida TaxID=303 RepID=A0A379KL73_PSEPU|nr:MULTISPECIES: hypothetical protein [Pseudomonas]QPN44151.1 hypothetical protein I5S86_21810 [Priestia aryabhattai]MBG6126836.1 hypothetical protein [Pseudomonas sp. M2]NSX22658.1 hypothetical protein [Pseudomonas putida]RRV44097.1 hypothetical protein EGJ09_18440 [Pseudomonas sp. p106]SUD68618.1 Uncharacterised protein [Pseudomonas putida]